VFVLTIEDIILMSSRALKRKKENDKFVLQAGEEEYAPLNFPHFKFEPLRSFLLKKDLEKLKEKGKQVRKNPKS
jgi:hypothetical protein